MSHQYFGRSFPGHDSRSAYVKLPDIDEPCKYKFRINGFHKNGASVRIYVVGFRKSGVNSMLCSFCRSMYPLCIL